MNGSPYHPGILLRGIPGFLLFFAAGAAADALPDITSVPADLTVPFMQDEAPAPGRRVREVLPSYAGSNVYHSLYLPSDWKAGERYPVIVEYPGNGPYRNDYGDVSTGRVEDCVLGYGISGGHGFIWVCLPFVSANHAENERQWWGDVDATVAYCKNAVRDVCERFGGDSGALLLAGFSRGSIAANYIGLHDDEIAALWRGFICHSHYDGVKPWGYAGSSRAAARRRLDRLGNRPQFISHEASVAETRAYLSEAHPGGAFTFVALPYRNHRADWVLRDIPERRQLRTWVASVLGR